MPRSKGGDRGFSLVEIVLALGIVSFCLLALYGLLPMGYKNAQDSRRETRAAFIAEQVVSDLRTSTFNNAAVLLSDANNNLRVSLPLDLGTTDDHFFGCDSENRLTGEVTSAEYNSGVTDGNVEFLSQIKIETTTFKDLSRVLVEVSAPPNVPLSARQRYSFVTFITKRQ